MAKLVGLTDSEITDAANEFGEVTIMAGHSKDRGSNKKFIPISNGLYDPKIFGLPYPKYHKCRCGAQKRPGRCPVCKELLVKEDDWINCVGFYSLAVPYVSSVKVKRLTEQLREFLDVGKIKAIGKQYSITDLVGCIWCVEFILTAVNEIEGENFGYLKNKDGDLFKLDVVESNESSLYTNCGLTGLYKILYNYNSAKSGESMRYMLEYINYKLIIAPTKMRPTGLGFNGDITYPQLSADYATIIDINEKVKSVIYGINGNEGTLKDKLAISNNINIAVNSLFDGLAILAQSHDSLIRYANTGRLPSSGRCNIISADTSVDTVLLPVSLAYESLKDQMIKKLTAVYAESNIDPKSLYENPTKEVMDIFEDMVNDSIVVINRQPTLYKYGMLAFHARLWKDTDFDYPTDASKVACIGMNILTCSPFNAD